MIYIIGGAPRVGKSIIAKRIAESNQTSFISTDDVCDKAIESLSDEERKIKFPLPGFSGTASENTLTPEERVQLSIISAKSLEPDIHRIILEALTKDESLVIEGVHFLPEYVRELITNYGTDKVKALFMGLRDIEAAIDGIMKNTSPDNWMRESNPDVIRQVAGFISALSNYTQEEAEQNNLRYEERTENFEEDMQRFSKILLGSK